jgi:tripartite-type tricarboxylate transporter receptor subunit TctC
MTSHSRRTLLIAAAAALVAASAQAQTWPSTSKPIRIIVPYAPGGTSDAVARLLAERMQLGQTVVVENRAGASGATGMDAVAKSVPDGHTLAFAAISPITLNPHLGKVPYDPRKDFASVARVMYSPIYVVATSAFNGKTFADAIAQAKANPGKLSVATSGMGSVGHVMLEQISRKAQVQFNHIPYKGSGQVTNDAAGGVFDLFTANPSPSVNALISQGRLHVLAVAAPRRLVSMPDVPTLEELGHADANLSSVFGIFAPAHTPMDVQKRINAEVNRVLADNDVRERLNRLDNVVNTGSIEELTAQVEREFDANARIVKAAGVRME